MYKIYADDKLLHAPHLTLNGCGVFSPKLVTELNKPDQLTYILPPNNDRYDDIKKLKTIITAYQREEEIFRGRVLNDEKDFYKQKRSTCEGELAFLLDSKQRPYAFSGTASALFRKFISNHNARVDPEKRFVVGEITSYTADMHIYAENFEYPNTLNEIYTQIIDQLGGYLRVRGSGGVRYIDWVEEYGVVNTQTIEFGVNLLDITEYISAENIYTVLIPLGGSLQDEEGNDLGRLTIVQEEGDVDYLENVTAISLFGRIENSMVYDGVYDVDALVSLGMSDLAQNIEMSVTLTVTAVDLHVLNVNVERIGLGDYVRVISIPHGLDSYFKCTKITYDMTNPDQTEYIFGVSYTSLTDIQANREKNIDSAVTIVKSSANAINHSVTVANQANQQVQQVQQVIAAMPTEYVQTSVFEAYKEEVSEDYTLKASFEELVARVVALEEGGTS